jgi:putative DNA primase/helicase
MTLHMKRRIQSDGEASATTWRGLTRLVAKPQSSSRRSREKATASALVKVTALARTSESKDWHKLLRLRDRDGRPHQVLVDRRQMRTEELFDLLDAHGVEVPMDKNAQQALRERLMQTAPKRRVCLVQRPGWHARRISYGNKTYGKEDEQLVLGDLLGTHVGRFEKAGSLEEWQDEIAAPCTHSSFLVFAICIGFAAPLLRVAEIEGGGFHFFGKSSKGKSSAQFVAATLYGSGKRSVGFARDWKATTAAQEEMGLGHCDFPLILDEMYLLDSDPKVAAQKAAAVAYSIAMGTCKARSIRYTGRVPEELRQYRTLILSSGELSFAAHAQAGGRSRYDGEEARLADVPVPSKATGICDRLPRGSTGKESRIRVDKLLKRAGRTFGTAGPAFLQQLVSEIDRDERELKERIKRRMAAFMREASADVHDGFQFRFARRFALAYAAGLLAIEYGIVPWERKLVLRSIRRCYRRAVRVQSRAGSEKPERIASRILKQVQSAQGIVDLTTGGSKPTAAEITAAPILKVAHADGLPMFAVQPRVFRCWVGPHAAPRAVARALEQMGALIPRSNGKRTRQIPIPGTAQRLDYYCIRPHSAPASWPMKRGR